MTMKINDPMKLLRKRGSNQYKTKQKGSSKVKNVLIIAGCLIAMAVIIHTYNAYQADPQVFKKVLRGDVSSVEAPVKQDALTAEERALIKKQAELMEKNMILDKKEKALEEKHAAEMARIEAEYQTAKANETNSYKADKAIIETDREAVRAEKVSL